MIIVYFFKRPVTTLYIRINVRSEGSSKTGDPLGLDQGTVVMTGTVIVIIKRRNIDANLLYLSPLHPAPVQVYRHHSLTLTRLTHPHLTKGHLIFILGTTVVLCCSSVAGNYQWDDKHKNRVVVVVRSGRESSES